MSDLISRSALLEELNNYHYDTVNTQTRRIEHIVNAHFIELIEKQPTAFDLEKVIAELKELKTYKLDLADTMTEIIARSNFQCRVAFSTASNIDSRIILGKYGAEKLKGCGDGIFRSNNGQKQTRFQSALITETEIKNAVKLLQKGE